MKKLFTQSIRVLAVSGMMMVLACFGFLGSTTVFASHFSVETIRYDDDDDDVTFSSALFGGEVKISGTGEPVIAYIRYGNTSTNLVSTTPERTFTAPGEVREVVSANADTEYYYKICAKEGSAPEVCGQLFNYKTPGIPAGAQGTGITDDYFQTHQPTSISYNSVTLGMTVKDLANLAPAGTNFNANVEWGKEQNDLDGHPQPLAIVNASHDGRDILKRYSPLDSDTTYYYRACLIFVGFNGPDKRCGDIEEFRTKVRPDTSAPVALSSPFGNNDLTFRGLIEIVLLGIMRIGVPLVALAIIYSGFLFVKAAYNPSKLAEAKMAFWYTLLGGALLLGAFILSQAIGGTVTDLQGGPAPGTNITPVTMPNNTNTLTPPTNNTIPSVVPSTPNPSSVVPSINNNNI